MAEYETDDSRNRKNRREEVKRAREKSEVAAERNFDIGVEPAGQRHATSRHGKTGDEQAHCQRTNNISDRRSGADLQCDCGWQREDSRANRGVYDISGKAWDPDRPNELMIGSRIFGCAHPKLARRTA